MSTPTTVAPQQGATSASWWSRIIAAVKPYIALTKPRIIELLLVTTIPTMVLAADGWPGAWLLVSTLIGGALSAGSANSFNSYLDRDIDAIMKRTSRRPLVTGAVSERNAVIFAWVLGVVSTAWFVVVVGSPLAAALSVAAILAYVVGYTMLLKRRTPQNIVWGGMAGCMPVLIGWAAVAQSLSWTPALLFLIIFFWTPPHYWPLSMKFKDEYRDAHVPMLPVVASQRRVTVEMVVYTIAMIIVTIVLVPVAGLTWVFLAVAAGAGLWFLAGVIRVLSRAKAGAPKLGEMRLFRDSITYLTLVFAALLVDPFLPNGLTVWS